MISRWRTRKAVLLLATMAALASCGGGGDGDYTFVDRGPELSAATKAKFDALPADLQARIETDVASTVSFVGSVDDTELYVGIITNGASIEVYLCDSDSTAAWFAGTAAGSSLSAADGSTSLTATRTDTGLEGSVTIDGATHGFTAVRASYPSDVWQNFALTAGGELVRGGWIVLSDDSQRGAIKQGPAIVTTGPLDLVAAAAGSTGDGAVPFSAPATPSEPVPFKSGQYKTKIPPPSPAAQCAHLAIKLDILLTVAGEHVNTDVGSHAAEEAAKVLKQGRELGCAFAGGTIGSAE